MRLRDDKIPVLLAELVISYDGTRLWTAYCPFCRKKHTHGAGDFGGRAPKYSHVWAHCEQDTPFKATGYYLQRPEPESQKKKP